MTDKDAVEGSKSPAVTAASQATTATPASPAMAAAVGFWGRLLHILPFSTLYYAQGLPYSIVRQMSAIYFESRGASLKSLGLVSLYGIPWTFKFLWSPLVDLVGTKRRWVVALEFFLTLAIGASALAIFHQVSLRAVAIFFVGVAFVSATHDIATDGFYLEALDKDGQARYSGWVVAAYRLAMLTGGGLLISLTGKIGWGGAFGAAALIFGALTLWHGLFLPHPPARAASTNERSTFQGFVEGFKAFLKLPGIKLALLFIVFFKLGDALLFGMSAIFIVKTLKLQMSDYTYVYGIMSTFGIVAAIGASIFGGWFISRHKLSRGLWIFGIIQNLSIPLYAVVALVHGAGPVVLGAALVVEQIAAGLGTAAYSNFLMRQIDPRFKATHYSIATGLMALTNMLGGVISGFGAQQYGFAVFFLLAFAASIPGIVLIPFVARRPECQ